MAGGTETGPVGTLSWVKGDLAELPGEERAVLRAKQVLAMPLIELRLIGNDGTEQPWDGKARGEVQIRGPWVATEYYNDGRPGEQWHDGWLQTGDVGVIDSEGYLQLVDRAKDLVKKSGGEWIRLVDLVGAIMGHSKVLEAAVIGVAHPKWQERPLACVVVKPGEELTKEEVLSFLEDKVAKVVVPRRRGVPRGDPEDEREQVLEEGASRPVRGLQPANRVAISRRTNPLRSAYAVGLGLKWGLARKEREDA